MPGEIEAKKKIPWQIKAVAAAAFGIFVAFPAYMSGARSFGECRDNGEEGILTDVACTFPFAGSAIKTTWYRTIGLGLDFIDWSSGTPKKADYVTVAVPPSLAHEGWGSWENWNTPIEGSALADAYKMAVNDAIMTFTERLDQRGTEEFHHHGKETGKDSEIVIQILDNMNQFNPATDMNMGWQHITITKGGDVPAGHNTICVRRDKKPLDPDTSIQPIPCPK